MRQDKEITAAAILAARTALNLTQAELAEKLGITQPRLAEWESAKAAPPNFLPLALQAIRHKHLIKAAELRPGVLTNPNKGQRARLNARLRPHLEPMRQAVRHIWFELEMQELGQGRETAENIEDAALDLLALTQFVREIIRGELTESPYDEENEGRLII